MLRPRRGSGVVLRPAEGSRARWRRPASVRFVSGERMGGGWARPAEWAAVGVRGQGLTGAGCLGWRREARARQGGLPGMRRSLVAGCCSAVAARDDGDDGGRLMTGPSLRPSSVRPSLISSTKTSTWWWSFTRHGAARAGRSSSDTSLPPSTSRQRSGLLAREA